MCTIQSTWRNLGLLAVSVSVLLAGCIGASNGSSVQIGHFDSDDDDDGSGKVSDWSVSNSDGALAVHFVGNGYTKADSHTFSTTDDLAHISIDQQDLFAVVGKYRREVGAYEGLANSRTWASDHDAIVLRIHCAEVQGGLQVTKTFDGQVIRTI